MKRFIVPLVAFVLALVGAPVAAADEGQDLSLTSVIQSGEIKSLDIETLVVVTEAAVDEYARQNGLPLATWVNIPSNESTLLPAACGMVAASWEMFGYCTENGVVYIGIDVAARLNQSHYLAAAFGIAHEYGHFLQQLANPAMDGDGQPYEDGADCVGGAWMAWFNQVAQLHLGLGDLPGISHLVASISRKSQYDPHGTYVDRGGAMIKGFFFGGLPTCNRDYAPIRLP